jgi:hypothetical protein
VRVEHKLEMKNAVLWNVALCEFNINQDGILYSHRRENLKSYINEDFHLEHNAM